MRYYLIISIALLMATVVNAQKSQITNWSSQYNFDVVNTYDHDLKRFTSNPIIKQSLLSIEMSNGTGRLAIFFQTKAAFQISKCEKEEDRYLFTLINNNDETVHAYLTIKNGYVYSFWLHNKKDNTSVVLYKYAE